MQNFNYHSHTYRCGHADLVEDEEYIKEYIKNGFKKIAFTDHCPEKNVIDERPNVRMAYNEKEEYLKNINALKEKYKDKIEIQVGYEVEYAPGNEENIRELNNDSLEEQKERLSNIGYPCKKFWEIASNYNIRVLYGIDVHRVGQISQYKNLITLANMVIGQDTIDKLNFISNEDTL